MNKPRLDAIVLSKVKRLKGNGLEVNWKWDESAKDREEVHNMKMNLESTWQIHPDMEAIFDELKGMFLTAFEYDKIEDDEQLRDVQFRMDITGVSISGAGDSEGATIKAKFETKSGRIRGLSTEHFSFTQNVFGFEERLGELCEDLKKEVYEYLYKNKVGEPQLFGEPQD